MIRTIRRHLSTLSTSSEFCCSSFGYTQPCTTCPFPPSLFEHLKQNSTLPSTQHTFINSNKKEQACRRLGLGPHSIFSATDLQQAFTSIALKTHPDTSPSSSSGEFQQAFAAYSLLRQYLANHSSPTTKKWKHSIFYVWNPSSIFLEAKAIKLPRWTLWWENGVPTWFFQNIGKPIQMPNI